MSANLNKVMFIGRLTDDPELKYTPSGTAMTKFRLAVNRVYKDSSGQKQEEVLFCPIVAWGNQAENCAKYLSKGRPIYLEGRLVIRDFEGDDGNTRRYTEVIAQNVQFLGSRSEGDSTDTESIFDREESPF